MSFKSFHSASHPHVQCNLPKLEEPFLSSPYGFVTCKYPGMMRHHMQLFDTAFLIQQGLLSSIKWKHVVDSE